MSVGEKLDEKIIEASRDAAEPWSMSRLHEKTGIALSYLYRVRSGRHVPSEQTLQAIVDTLNVPADDLFLEREIDELERDAQIPRPLAELAVVLRHADLEAEEALLERIAQVVDQANGPQGNSQ